MPRFKALFLAAIYGLASWPVLAFACFFSCSYGAHRGEAAWFIGGLEASFLADAFNSLTSGVNAYLLGSG